MFLKSVFDLKTKPTDLPEVLLLGRSNVGKSSFINNFFQSKIAKVSQKPGKTIALNYFKYKDLFYLVDTPGYGFAKVDLKTQQDFTRLLGTYIGKQEYSVVLMLMDFFVGPTTKDLEMYTYLTKQGITPVICFTKLDKEKKSKIFSKKNQYRTQFPNTALFFVNNGVAFSSVALIDYLTNLFKEKNAWKKLLSWPTHPLT